MPATEGDESTNGNDYIEGGGGNDAIDGGPGDDLLSGSTILEQDRFEFVTRGGRRAWILASIAVVVAGLVILAAVGWAPARRTGASSPSTVARHAGNQLSATTSSLTHS